MAKRGSFKWWNYDYAKKTGASALVNQVLGDVQGKSSGCI